MFLDIQYDSYCLLDRLSSSNRSNWNILDVSRHTVVALKSTAVYKGCAAAARGQSTRLVSACMLEPCLEGISSTWTSLMPNCLGWFNLGKRIDWICAYRAHWTVPTPCRPSLEMAFYSQDLSLYFCTYTIKDSITYILCLFYRWPNPYTRPLWYIIFWRPR